MRIVARIRACEFHARDSRRCAASKQLVENDEVDVNKSALLIGLPLAAIACLIGGIAFDQTILSVASVLILIAFAYLSWTLAKQNPAEALRHADNIYFVGYLLTIIGVAGIALRIGLHPDLIEKEQDRQSLLTRGGIALFSTIIGLAGMITFKNRFSDVSIQVDEIEHRVQRQMRSLAEETERLLKALQDARKKGIEELNQQFKSIDFKSVADNFKNSLGESGRQFADDLKAAQGHVQGLAIETKKLAADARRMNASVPILVTKLESLAKSFSENKDALEELVKDGAAVGKLNVALTTAANTLDAITTKAKTSEEGIKDLATCIKELETAVSEFVKFTQNSMGKGMHGVPQKFPVGSRILS